MRIQPLDRVREQVVILPPGERVVDGYLEALDDRDVVGCLWVPFHEARLDRIASRLGDADRRTFAAERARVAKASPASTHAGWFAAEAKAVRCALLRFGVRLALAKP